MEECNSTFPSLVYIFLNWFRSKLMNKKTAVLGMVSMLALTACGGGGGGSISITAPTPTNIGTVSFDSLISNSIGNLAVIKTVTADGKVTAQEAVQVFEWMNNNSIDESVLKNYTVEVDGVATPLDQAWNKLKGYKKVYYDGKETFWKGVADSGTFDDETGAYLDVKAFADNEDKIDFEKVGTGEITIEDVKDIIVPVVEEPIVEEPIVEEPIVEEPIVEEPIVEEPIVEEPIVEVTEVSREQVAKELQSQVVESTVAGDVSKSFNATVDCTNQILQDGTTHTGTCDKYRVQTNMNENLIKTWNVTYNITYSDNSVKAITVVETSTHIVPASPVITYEYIKNGDAPVEEEEVVEEEEEVVEEENNTSVSYANVVYTHSDLGTVTPGAIKDNNLYRTDEFFGLADFVNDNVLSTINADAAWSRGWTGKGSIVVIADSGANVNHTDLDGNIGLTKNFLDNSTDVSDSNGHGTHVAGITGAELDGNGIIGVAPDVTMMIAKVTDNTAYSFYRAKKAAQWGKDNGAIAINVSAEVRLDNGFKRSLTLDGNGQWHSTHWYYGVNGYNGAKDEATGWKTALGDDMVLVKAAGNQGYEYSPGMNQMATATDSNGNLILDGQMLVVGSWDIANNQISGFSNKAGTVCTTYVNDTCTDAASISDYYILAPGTSVYSTDNNGTGYVHMSGTSMAAPVVTGAVAIVNQMWPHMKGKNLVRLLTETADKTIANYNVNTHGQGLLDLDKATQPVGVTGIPTTGRTNGSVSSLSGYVSGSSGAMSELASVMVLDSYERDFYVDMSTSYKVDTRANKFTHTLAATNMYAGYSNYDQHLALPHIALNDNLDHQWTIQPGFFNEANSFLGNSQSGVFGNLDNAYTTYANFNYNASYNDVKVFGQFGLGYTKNSYSNEWSMLSKAGDIYSSTWSAGVEKNGWGASVSQPVTIETASMTYNVPTSRDMDGNVNNTETKVNMKTDERNLDFTAYYKYNIDTVDFKAYVEQRTGGFADTNLGVQIAYKF